MEKENNTEAAINQYIVETNKLVQATNDAMIANANRQTDILEVQTNLYRNTLLLVGVNLIIGLGILITTFISYSDKKEIATLHVQLRDRDEHIRVLQASKPDSLPIDEALSTTTSDKKK